MDRINIILILVCVFISLCLIRVDESFSEGVIVDSIGVVSSGRGGTNITQADNGTLIHDNPAALVNFPSGKQFDASAHLIYPEIKFEDIDDSDYSKHKIVSIPTLSFIYKKSEDSKFAFGLGVYIPAGFDTEYHLDHSVKGIRPFRNISFGSQLYNSEVSLTKLLFATSYKVNKNLSIGFALGPSFQKASIESPSTFQTGRLAGMSALIDIDAEDNFGLSYTAGIQYRVSENTMLGLSFISESKSTLRGETDISIPDSVPGSRFLIDPKAEYDVKSNIEWPRTIGIGVSHLINRSHKLSFDMVWFNWASAFDRFDYELTDGDNKQLNNIAGAKVNDILPLDWDDVFAYRFGYEYFFQGESNSVLRFGYVFNENPIPDNTLQPLIPGTLKHNFTLGYSRKFWQIEASVASQFSIGDPESVDNSNIVGGDYENSSIKTKVYGLLFGIAYHF